MINLLAVRNTVIIVFFVPIACLVLGMIFDHEWTDISEEEQRHWNQNS
jgi:hypothetical protein